MGRRKRTSAAENFLDIVATLPWWAGVVLAVLSYLLLASLAARGTPAATPTQVGPAVVSTVVAAFSQFLQYVVPVLCLIGAGMSAYRRSERAALLAKATGGDTSLEVSRMTWHQFELLIGEAFRSQGYSVAELGGSGPDGGVDLVLTKDGVRYLVQCKQWRAFKVGVSVVRELFGVMAAQRAAGGYLVTSGRLTEEAKAFAVGKNITLIDGDRLGKFLRSGQQDRPPRESVRRSIEANPQSTSRQDAGNASFRAAAEKVPLCPRCSKAMVRRVARQGARSGQAFWGCSGYPGCRGTVGVDD
jgi:restriction system protein